MTATFQILRIICFKSKLPNHAQITDLAFLKSHKKFLSCKLIILKLVLNLLGEDLLLKKPVEDKEEQIKFPKVFSVTAPFNNVLFLLYKQYISIV